jgi:hypothetical protein
LQQAELALGSGGVCSGVPLDQNRRAVVQSFGAMQREGGGGCDRSSETVRDLHGTTVEVRPALGLSIDPMLTEEALRSMVAPCERDSMMPSCTGGTRRSPNWPLAKAPAARSLLAEARPHPDVLRSPPPLWDRCIAHGTDTRAALRITRARVEGEGLPLAVCAGARSHPHDQGHAGHRIIPCSRRQLWMATLCLR